MEKFAPKYHSNRSYFFKQIYNDFVDRYEFY